jgi:protein gp37
MTTNHKKDLESLRWFGEKALEKLLPEMLTAEGEVMLVEVWTILHFAAARATAEAESKAELQWCDYTWNPWWGCSMVSPGCAHCVATMLSGMREGKRHKTSPANWRRPSELNCTKICISCGKIQPVDSLACACSSEEFRKPRIFSVSMGDWLDDEVPIEWFSEMLFSIELTSNLEWLLPTKRPELWKARLEKAVKETPGNKDWISNWLNGNPPGNVMVGVSVENQKTADYRIGKLMEIPARGRFISFEPLLESIDTTGFSPVDWVIVGRERGQRRRPFRIEWADSIKSYCDKNVTPLFLKESDTLQFCDLLS